MTRSPFVPKFSDLPADLPVFPLPGAVVMPGVQLPLNIFEPRYLNMVQDALAAEHLIGMVQPLSRDEDENAPRLHRVGCAGRITSYSETNDGRIILVLTGVCRFEIVEELEPRRGYRHVRPDWERFTIDYHAEENTLGDRDSFVESLKAYSRLRGVEIPWDDIKSMNDADLVDLLCTHLPLPPDDKQALIETIGLTDRADLMQGLMDMSSVSSVEGVEQRH
jgi:Lon protease-like protein